MYIIDEIPDINEYQDGFLNYWAALTFIGKTPKDYQINALTTTYIRLVEASLVEYRLGQSRLREYLDTSTSFNFSAMYKSVSHFESCLSNMHRAIKCFRRLHRHIDLPENLRKVLKANKPKFIAAQIFDQLSSIRHEIHHLEEHVVNSKLQPGQRFLLGPDGPEVPHPTEPNQTNKTFDRLVIGKHQLLFADLSSWLKEMGKFAEIIVDSHRQT